MGLDMSYHRTRSTATFGRENPEPVESEDGTVVPWENLGGMFYRTEDVLIGYQRKANAIHGWIVANLADGEDECQEITLSLKDVEHLLADIETALADPTGNDVLAPTQGFFFGGYDRDEWYLQDLQDAKRIMLWIKADMERVGDGVSLSGPDYRWYYQASW